MARPHWRQFVADAATFWRRRQKCLVTATVCYPAAF